MFKTQCLKHCLVNSFFLPSKSVKCTKYHDKIWFNTVIRPLSNEGEKVLLLEGSERLLVMMSVMILVETKIDTYVKTPKSFKYHMKETSF